MAERIRGPKQALIYEYLRPGQHATISDMFRDEPGLYTTYNSANHLRNTLRRMIDEGIVGQPTPGVYVLRATTIN